MKNGYQCGDLVIVRGRALSKDDNAFFVGMVLSESNKRLVKEYDDMWNTRELVWEKVYNILTQGRIISVTYYDIKGRVD